MLRICRQEPHPKKAPFHRKGVVGRDAEALVGRVAEAHAHFSKWTTKWEWFNWAVGEFNVWSEMHRIGSTMEKWKGQNWSDAWATEVVNFIEGWQYSRDLTLNQKQRIALGLRRLSTREGLSGKITGRLVLAAVTLGDSPELPLELIIDPAKLEDTGVPPPLPQDADLSRKENPSLSKSSGSKNPQPTLIQDFRSKRLHGHIYRKAAIPSSSSFSVPTFPIAASGSLVAGRYTTILFAILTSSKIAIEMFVTKRFVELQM
ncbi:hypothetical protein K438DRAFT_955810 [Mycena galopus ATCC 62051]|nr:hypothetical protein K438DRAFT_955810 [Mycena galopus ATCC 62051]